MTQLKRIGVLTGGGDCPGLNAVIRAVTKDAIRHGVEVVGIEDGFLGLIEDRTVALNYERVSNILTVGGTILGSSNRANPARFAVGTNADGSPIFEDVTDRCMGVIDRLGLDALVVIGGDGTMSCAGPFVERGVNCLGVPKTIDNDLWGTDLTFGHLTAVQIASDALDRVHTTAASHHRVMVVEVMGRNAGWIALGAGISSGADAILIPEIPFDLGVLCELIARRSDHGKRFTIVCCAEGARPAGGEQVASRVDPTSPDPIRLGGIARWLADRLEACSGVEARQVVLGHVQRGGSPIAQDRVLATLFGNRAVDLLLAGARNRLVAWVDGRLTDVPLLDARDRQRLVPMDDPLIAAARSVYTSFGTPE